MKAKCPICKFDTTNNPNSTGLFRHLMDKHTDHEVTSYLVGLLFKIDAKIEAYESEAKQHNIENQRTDASIVTAYARVLKSLLENKT